MDDHSGRFVDHRQRIVFENDVERNIFRFESRHGRLGQFDLDLVIFADFI